jgi:hypothetical protein
MAPIIGTQKNSGAPFCFSAKTVQILYVRFFFFFFFFRNKSYYITQAGFLMLPFFRVTFFPLLLYFLHCFPVTNEFKLLSFTIK